MLIRLSHPARETSQCVISERDAKWLETQGWKRIPVDTRKLTDIVTVAATDLDPPVESRPVLHLKKRGRPAKAV